MSEKKLFTQQEQIALVDGARERMDASVRAWLENPKVKRALLSEPVEADCKEAS